jgi:transcriptional regulator with PAS, ATPase and Fis domain
MKNSKPKLNILVDSREPSVSFARSYCNESGIHSLGVVEHIRVQNFAERLEALLLQCTEHDEILISVHHITEEQLERAAVVLRRGKCAKGKITLASYDCFTHIREWCLANGCRFLANPYKRRTYPKDVIRHKRAKNEHQHIGRIWSQYRLMLAIISRTSRLSDVCRQLIQEHAAKGDSLENEYNRALRYFELGEPDMAGGSYSCEEIQKYNPIDELRFRLNKIAATDFNILIKGESGSGKETIAWSIHELSSRRDKSFIVINCAGLPDELLESEMFGYRKGSHNQAYDDAPGLLDSADGGTLFLDELPEMSPRIQAKLLRFIESGEYRPLGSSENRYSNIRILAAGQSARVDEPGMVRPDLKSRISQLDVELLPLREVEKRGPGTLHKIAFILLERYTWTTIFHENRQRELTPLDIKNFQEKLALPQNQELLCRQEWRVSNIRELNNFLRKWIVFGDDEFILLRQPIASGEKLSDVMSSPVVQDEALQNFLANPINREELKELFSKKPLQSLKNAYIRHIFAIYSKIIEQENLISDMPQKATQKELAKLMGVTENTISRLLN